MCATHLLVMLYLSVKFHQICFSSLRDIAETRFVKDGRTDRRTDRRTDGEILICHPKFLRGHKNGFIQETFWFLRYRHFCVYASFSNGPRRPSWIVNLHKFEIVPFKKSKRLYTRNILAQNWIHFVLWFWRYCHFRVCAVFSTGPWRPS